MKKILVLFLFMIFSACGQDPYQDLEQRPQRVAGIYLITEGTISLIYNDRADVTAYTEKDFYKVSVHQSGKTVEAFGCMGELTEDLETDSYIVNCNYYRTSQLLGINKCESISGELIFKKGTIRVYTYIYGVWPRANRYTETEVDLGGIIQDTFENSTCGELPDPNKTGSSGGT